MFRRLLRVTWALTLLTALAGLPSFGSGARAATDEATFADLLSQATSQPVVFGPEKGDLVLDPDRIAIAAGDVDLTDFAVHVEFTNPYDASEAPFDFGVLFRLAQGQDHLRLVIVSTGDWAVFVGTGDPTETGTLDGLTNRAGQKNSIDLIAIGDTGYFGVNDQFVSKIDLSAVTHSGDIAIGSSFLPDDFQTGAVTGYANYVIWSFDENGVAPTATPRGQIGRRTTPTPETQSSPAAGGTEYISPAYGYSFTYDDTWSVSDESSKDGADYIRLDNGVSVMDFTGYATDATTDECVQGEFDYYSSTDGYTNVEVAKDSNNKEMRGGNDAFSYGVFWFTYQSGNGQPTDYTAYVECDYVEQGVSIVRIVQFVPFDDYNDQIEARVAVLDTFTLTGGTSTPVSTEEATVEPTEEATVVATEEATVEPAGSGSYTSPNFGFTVQFDDSWTIADQTSDQNGDYIRLQNGVSSIDLRASDRTDTPEQCVQSEFDYFSSAAGFADARVATDASGKKMQGSADGSSFAVFQFTYTDQDNTKTDYTVYVECREIEPGVSMLKIDHFAPDRDYDKEVPARDAVLDTISFGGSEVTPEPSPRATTGTGGAETVTFQLDEVDGSGVTGLASIDAADGKSDVSLLVVGAPDGAIALIHKGTCADLDPKPAYLLGDVSSGSAQATVKASLDDLLAGPYAIAIHASVAELDTQLACGDIAS